MIFILLAYQTSVQVRLFESQIFPFLTQVSLIIIVILGLTIINQVKSGDIVS